MQVPGVLFPVRLFARPRRLGGQAVHEYPRPSVETAFFRDRFRLPQLRNDMRLVADILLMIVFPVASIIAEAVLAEGRADLILLFGKWFVFWAVGIRLLVTAFRQITNPGAVAEALVGAGDRNLLPLVQEMGFGNLAVGALGVAAFFRHDWIAPAAVAGEIVLSLAALKHSINPARSRSETIAMIADLLVFAVLTGYLTAISV
jgi:hypothetical protein